MEPKQPATSFESTLAAADPGDKLFDLPEFDEETCRLMERPPPTLAQQLNHARMLLRWRKEQGLPDPHPPRQTERFVLE